MLPDLTGMSDGYGGWGVEGDAGRVRKMPEADEFQGHGGH